MMGDDFCIDENAGVAYIATHRQNTIDRVSLEPSENSYLRHSVAGKPFTEQLRSHPLRLAVTSCLRRPGNTLLGHTRWDPAPKPPW